MPLEQVRVNLWKTSEVSYLQLDSYSTESDFGALCESNGWIDHCEKTALPIWFYANPCGPRILLAA
jgi:hypothetical protein